MKQAIFNPKRRSSPNARQSQAQVKRRSYLFMLGFLIGVLLIICALTWYLELGKDSALNAFNSQDRYSQENALAVTSSAIMSRDLQRQNTFKTQDLLADVAALRMHNAMRFTKADEVHHSHLKRRENTDSQNIHSRHLSMDDEQEAKDPLLQKIRNWETQFLNPKHAQDSH